MAWLGGGHGVTQVWALGKHSWTVSKYAYPPAKVSDEIFRPTQRGGYGVRLDDFFWKQFKTPSERYVNCR